MKDNKRLFALIALVMLISVLLPGQQRKLREVGRYRFFPMEAGTATPEMIKATAEKYADDIRRGFEVAGTPELYSPFMDQVRKSAFTERQLAVGSTMLWMLFRSQGEIKIVRDLQWAGREPLQVCSFSIQEGDKKYEIIVPEACGNIALERVETAPGAAEPEPAAKQPPFEPKPEDRYQISPAKIYQEIADLINEVDLYCSFFAWEKEIPELQIIGAEREDEKTMFSNGDNVFLSKGKDGAIEPGQIFWVLEITDQFSEYGLIAIGRGRVRVLHTTENRSVAVVEHTCDRIRLGCFLVPFEPKEGMMGKDLGYDVPPVETEGARGRVAYFQGTLNQVGSLMWALIDIGADKGLQVGQQLILYRKIRPDLPIVPLGSCVVIDVKSKTSTVKVLSCKDVIRKGDWVMERPS